MDDPLRSVLPVLFAGVETVAPGHRFSPVRLLHPAVVCTLSGEAWVDAGARRIRYAPETAVVLPPSSAIHESVGGDEPWRVAYAVFDGPWADRLRVRLEAGPFLAEPASAVRRAVAAAAASEGWERVAAIARLLALLEPAPPQKGSIATVVRVVGKVPGRTWSVGEIARAAGVTPRMLTYSFRREAGVPLATWLRRRRVAEATRLLRAGFNVTQTAERLGFATPFHFSRLYKNATGISPSVILRRPSLLQSETSPPDQDAST